MYGFSIKCAVSDREPMVMLFEHFYCMCIASWTSLLPLHGTQAESWSGATFVPPSFFLKQQHLQQKQIQVIGITQQTKMMTKTSMTIAPRSADAVSLNGTDTSIAPIVRGDRLFEVVSSYPAVTPVRQSPC